MEKRVCEVCGEEFEPRRKDQRGCGGQSVTRKCAWCGAAFSARRKYQLYCSKRCRRYAETARANASWRGEISAALQITALPTAEHLMTAKRKPKNTSAARWRMELARRADPERFALAGVATF